MNRKIGKRILITAILIVITLSILYLLNDIFVIKRSDGITPMKSFYMQEEDTVDVLILGSSHAGMNLDAAELWNEYGIASYALWGSIQPFWNSYYFLKEALKSQTTSVVILEVYAATKDFEYSDDARQITNVDGMRYSLNKLQASIVSAPPERWLDLFFGLPLYHNRYTEITENDFQYFAWSEDLINSKGTSYRYGTYTGTIDDVSGINEVAEIYEKEEKYLRMIIELCQKEEIPIILIATPNSGDKVTAQPYYNSVELIAEEYAVDFYNFNLMEDELGFTLEDYWTDGAHINTNGARKVSDWLGNLLVTEYGIEDHRSDADYASWDVFSEQVNNNYLKAITGLDDYFAELKRRDLAVFVIKNSNWDMTEEYNELLNAMDSIGIDRDVIEEYTGGNLFLDSTQGGVLENHYYGNMYSEFEFDGVVFSADFSSGTGIMVDGETVYNLEGSGIILVVYDKGTDKCLDVVTFLVKNQFQLKHSG